MTVPTLALLPIGLLLAAASPAAAAILFFDFGAGGTPSPVPTNNVAEAQAAIANATDTTGSATGISVTSSNFNSSNTAGTLAPTGSAAIFDAATTRDSLFGNALLQFGTGAAGAPRANATVTFSGLDATGATRYSFDIFASRLGGTLNRESQYVLAGATTSSVLLNATDNISNVASVNNLAANGAGQISLTVGLGPNNNTAEGFYYLGAVRLTTAPIPEPTTALLALLGGAAAFRRRRI